MHSLMYVKLEKSNKYATEVLTTTKTGGTLTVDLTLNQTRKTKGFKKNL